jgi:hypothetical protein
MTGIRQLRCAAFFFLFFFLSKCGGWKDVKKKKRKGKSRNDYELEDYVQSKTI